MLYIIKSIYVKVYSLLFVSPETYLYFHSTVFLWSNDMRPN